MITYKLSKREKALLFGLAIVVVVVAWFVLVYQRTTNEITHLEGEISVVQTSIDLDETRIAQKKKMQDAIDQRKAEGAQIASIPTYDNMKPLMTELDRIMGSTDTYSLSFDKLDTESTDYIMRGVGITFGANTYEIAEAVVRDIANGVFPCIVDSVSISDNTGPSILGRNIRSGGSNFNGNVHVIFMEKPAS